MFFFASGCVVYINQTATSTHQNVKTVTWHYIFYALIYSFIHNWLGCKRLKVITVCSQCYHVSFSKRELNGMKPDTHVHFNLRSLQPICIDLHPSIDLIWNYALCTTCLGVKCNVMFGKGCNQKTRWLICLARTSQKTLVILHQIRRHHQGVVRVEGWL